MIQKRALDSDIRRHYTGHDTFMFMAGVETLKEVHEVCRLPVDRSFTFTWGTDCGFDMSRCQVMACSTVWMPSNGLFDSLDVINGINCLHMSCRADRCVGLLVC